ncbi:MAG: peptidase C26 [Peptococcaceae bacterium BICA1-7]|nr:MAG: peptidase C26 [Peptococcaceae bacterium BICA1-7]HBV98106.1 peptidase C26 [Desulfotomaculum sp.]
MKPFIGITCSWDEEKGQYFLGGMYVEAVEAGGGIPIPLAYSQCEDDLKRICASLNGLVLSGGGDVDPHFFGEEPISAVGEICPGRDKFEISLARQALAANIPILGICRGMQVLNIAAGGDIYQDIANQLGERLIKHSQMAPRWHPTHEITVAGETLLSSILRPGVIRVNSFHHQAVRNPAPGFIISARSPDGVAEAIESRDSSFTLGVQCHPETLWKREPAFLTLFERLSQSARMRFAIN